MGLIRRTRLAGLAALSRLSGLAALSRLTGLILARGAGRTRLTLLALARGTLILRATRTGWFADAALLLRHLQVMLQRCDVLLRELLHVRIGVALRSLLIQRQRTFMRADLRVHELLVEVRAREAGHLIDHALVPGIKLIGNLHVLLIGEFLELIDRLLMVLYQSLREIFGLLILRFLLSGLTALHFGQVFLVSHLDELLRILCGLSDLALSAGGFTRSARADAAAGLAGLTALTRLTTLARLSALGGLATLARLTGLVRRRGR
ncbi:MAG: hypothetical protein JWO95_3596 [Verrucomicrobiales bacterium]|nr:hypothetical protein [Verrucomicrobiales bacterium]